ncbi:type II toxin-antitoxin system VapC family toxin [Euzebya sp.]|uniref:type II toxin-antitoxin system VapC family toxin n=1 Tax=Euzebya sp. TaxID=1971409 RepID=UPI0035197E1E
MPTAADAALLVDTSVAVPLVVSDHEDHAEVRDGLRGRTLGLAGHAAFETYSVLTRLPAPLRRSPSATQRLLTANFPATRFLDEGATAALRERLAHLGIAGGAVYDALVGATALHHRLPLVTRDHRATGTYRKLDVPLWSPR